MGTFMVPTWGLAASGGTWAGSENYFRLTLGAWRLARKKAFAIRQGLCRDSGPMLPGDCPTSEVTAGLLKRKTPRLKARRGYSRLTQNWELRTSPMFLRSNPPDTPPPPA